MEMNESSRWTEEEMETAKKGRVRAWWYTMCRNLPQVRECLSCKAVGTTGLELESSEPQLDLPENGSVLQVIGLYLKWGWFRSLRG